jgi:predicted nucleic acid-binding protein
LTRYLVDTNVLLRSIQFSSPAHPIAVNALNVLLTGDDDICLAAQNLIELWNVCTRPLDRNGLGLNIAQVDAELTKLESIFTILPEIPTIYAEWRRLVFTYRVMGVNVHDTKLVAAMTVYKISHILTFNTKDFQRFHDIVVVDPSELALKTTGS